MESALSKGLAVIAVSVWLSPLAFALPAGEGESLVREHCSSCHRPEILDRAQGCNTASEWRQLMEAADLDVPGDDLSPVALRYFMQVWSASYRSQDVGEDNHRELRTSSEEMRLARQTC